MPQNILVCTGDGVLAKKLQFLLAHEDRAVEVCEPAGFEPRLAAGGLGLVVLSRDLGGRDALSALGRLSQRRALPPALVIGGPAVPTPPGVHLVERADDSQAIFELASEALGEGDRSSPLRQRSGVPFDDEVTRAEGDEDTLDRAVTARVTQSELELTTEVGALRARRQPLRPASTRRPEAPPPQDLETTRFGAAGIPAPSADGERVTVTKAQKTNFGLSGTVQPATLAKALFQCWTMEAQGALVIEGRDERLTIHFEGGMPVGVVGDRPGDLLGRNLVAKGRIAEDHYGRAAKRAIEVGVGIGQALVELGILSRDALGEELGEQAHERIVECFGWQGGKYDFAPDRELPGDERPFQLAVGRVLADGLREAPDEALQSIVGAIDGRYFRVRSPIEVLLRRFPLDDREQEFLGYSGRAYNAADAADLAGLDERRARVLMALLTVAEELEDFTPGVREFEARIKEERARSLRPAPAAPPPMVAPPPMAVATPPPMPAPPPVSAPRPPAPMPPPLARPAPAPPAAPPPPAKLAAFEEGEPVDFTSDDEPPALLFEASADPDAFSAPFLPQNGRQPSFPPPLDEQVSRESLFEGVAEDDGDGDPTRGRRAAPEFPPPAPPPARPAPPPPVPAPSKIEARPSIPPMPVANGSGRIPRDVVFSPPTPRGPDGGLQDTPERQRSREHFQRGVALLGQGNFDEAEDSFREAVRLCADEHVYLIGLARAIYYNPGYTGMGKLPVLRSIVDRARGLAPDDARVTTLSDWVRYAEGQHGLI